MRKAKGFTLLEFILYFALLSIIMTTVTIFSIDLFQARAKARVIAEVEQNSRFGLLRILRAIRQANQLNVGSSVLNSDNGVLSLGEAAASTDPTVFDLSGGTLRIKEGVGTATPLTSAEVTITKLRFAKDNLGGNTAAITAEMNMQYKNGDANNYFNYSTSASGTAVIRKD